MTIIIDIDETIFFSKKIDDYPYYEIDRIDEKEIKLINELYDSGHIIIIHTGRNWDKYEVTTMQLKNNNVKYHQLVMGKPQGIYIDKDSYKTLKECLDENILD